MINKKRDQTHELARLQVETWLISKHIIIMEPYEFHFPPEFVNKHSLGTRSRPNTSHTFDILTAGRIIEIDDYGKHSKKSQKINDGIARDYVETYQKHMKFHRLQKEEIVNEKGQIQPDCASYLRKNLF